MGKVTLRLMIHFAAFVLGKMKMKIDIQLFLEKYSTKKRKRKTNTKISTKAIQHSL